MGTDKHAPPSRVRHRRSPGETRTIAAPYLSVGMTVWVTTPSTHI
jgi:hypothetical protein